MTTDLALPTNSQWELMKRQGSELIKSGFLPSSIRTPEQFMAIVIKGRELGIPPMLACSHIHIINGKPTMSAELMLAQIMKLHPQTKISYPIRSSEECQLKVTRVGNEPSIFSFSMKDAQAAGLMGNPTWKKYPRAMLHARCVSEMARSLFPDAISGVSYCPEELGAQVNENGEVIDVTATESKQEPAQETVVDVPPVAETKPTVDSQPATPVIEKFAATNIVHRGYIEKYLVSREAIRFYDKLMIAMSGKDFRKSVVDEEWAKINPEAPDKDPT